MKTKTYAEKKAEAEATAIEWAHNFSEYVNSYAELQHYTKYFEKIGRRYGLLKVFRLNSVI